MTISPYPLWCLYLYIHTHTQWFEAMTITPYPLWCLYFSTSCKRTPPVSGQLCLVPRVSAYGRFDCIHKVRTKGIVRATDVMSLRFYYVITFSIKRIAGYTFCFESSFTVGIVFKFITATCKFFEFLGLLYSGHVGFQI